MPRTCACLAALTATLPPSGLLYILISTHIALHRHQRPLCGLRQRLVRQRLEELGADPAETLSKLVAVEGFVPAGSGRFVRLRRVSIPRGCCGWSPAARCRWRSSRQS